MRYPHNLIGIYRMQLLHIHTNYPEFLMKYQNAIIMDHSKHIIDVHIHIFSIL